MYIYYSCSSLEQNYEEMKTTKYLWIHLDASIRISEYLLQNVVIFAVSLYKNYILNIFIFEHCRILLSSIIYYLFYYL